MAQRLKMKPLKKKGKGVTEAGRGVECKTISLLAKNWVLVIVLCAGYAIQISMYSWGYNRGNKMVSIASNLHRIINTSFGAKEHLTYTAKAYFWLAAFANIIGIMTILIISCGYQWIGSRFS